ncbi:hypothetical protein AB0M47_32495 [Hamadaea sp. NPDC051192]|uniref:hypothetical protein n=1 Tax=Hamadaea sp. NPDC051192 TaxID=3154940 RepID=UPI00342FBFC6
MAARLTEHGYNESNVPHPRASALIFWPPNGDQDTTAEQIVDTALSYRPVGL